jgi:DNA-binding NarL/FixJ family response regulator
MKAGALGYLLKEDSFTQLVDAIRAVNRGEIFVSSTL